jgi:hypothetical protein
MLNIQEWEEELNYIQTQSVRGSIDWRNLTTFNKDYECFNNYIEMQAKSADKDGFPGISNQMLNWRL